MAKKYGVVAVLLGGLLLVGGCAPLLLGAGAAGGAGTMLYAKGYLEEQLQVSVNKAHDATIGALQSLELPVKKDMKDKVTAEIDSEFSDGKDIAIRFKSLSPSITRIRIRVGIFGDEARARRILKEIHKKL